MNTVRYSRSDLSTPEIIEESKTPDLFTPLSVASIRMNLNRPSLGLFLFLLGFNGMYFLPFVFPQALYEDAISGIYRYYFLSWILILAGGFIETWANSFWLIRRKPLWSALLVSAVSIMLLRGVLDGETVISAVSKSLPFYWLLVVPALGSRKENWSWLWTILLFHAVFGSLYFIYVSFGQSNTSREAIINYVGQNFWMQSLYMAGFIFLSFPAMKEYLLRGLAITLFILNLLHSLFFYSRLETVLSFLYLLLVGYTFLRSKQRLMFVHRILFSGTLLALFFVGLIMAVPNLNRSEGVQRTIGEAYDGLMGRFLQQGNFTDTIEQDLRWLETRVILTSMTKEDWIIGKGLIARWSSSQFLAGEERAISHNTFLNAFFWGGIFLFLVITLPILWSIHVLLRSHRVEGIISSAYTLLVYTSLPFFLTTRTSQDWVLFCLVLGICVWHEAVLSEYKTSRQYSRHRLVSQKATPVSENPKRLPIIEISIQQDNHLH